MKGVWIVALLFFVGSVSAGRNVFKKFSDPMLGDMKLTYAFQLKDKLSHMDKQHVLDMHNALRNKLATGNETNSWDGGSGTMSMPTASNMQAMMWDDDLAAYAQNYASQCKTGHSDLKALQSNKRFDKTTLAENLSGDLTALETDMYGEVKWWNYEKFACNPNGQCGHYKNFVGWGINYIGCGWKVCPASGYTRMVMVCIYSGFTATATLEGHARQAFQHEYMKGKPCSECMQGWDFCMGGGLCATKAQCESNQNKECVCLHQRSLCEGNGGTFDGNACTCTCPANKMGINCAKACANTLGPDDCGMECSKGISGAHFCEKTCGSCGQKYSAAYKFFHIDRPALNAERFIIRATFPDSDPKAEATDMTKKPNYNSCKNTAKDVTCEKIFLRGYCNGTGIFKPTIVKACGLSCGTCSSGSTTTGTTGGGGWESVGGTGTFDASKALEGVDFSKQQSVDSSGIDVSSLGLGDLSGFNVVGRRRRRR